MEAPSRSLTTIRMTPRARDTWNVVRRSVQCTWTSSITKIAACIIEIAYQYDIQLVTSMHARGTQNMNEHSKSCATVYDSEYERAFGILCNSAWKSKCNRVHNAWCRTCASKPFTANDTVTYHLVDLNTKPAIQPQPYQRSNQNHQFEQNQWSNHNHRSSIVEDSTTKVLTPPPEDLLIFTYAISVLLQRQLVSSLVSYLIDYLLIVHPSLLHRLHPT